MNVFYCGLASHSFYLQGFQSFLRAGAVEVMIMCTFAACNSIISTPFTALTAFLEYFAQFDWKNWEITATGPVDRKTLIPTESSTMYTHDIQNIVEKYRKLWLSSKEGTTTDSIYVSVDNESSLRSESLDNINVAVMDLLQPGIFISLWPFLGLRSDQQHLLAEALTNTFKLATDDVRGYSVKIGMSDKAEVKDMLFKNINAVTRVWHVRACQSTPWTVSSTQMLETPDAYISDVLSMSEFIATGKITGNEIVRSSAYILTFEGKPMRAADLMASLQIETGNNRKLHSIRFPQLTCFFFRNLYSN